MINKRTMSIQLTGWDKDRSTLRLLLLGIQKSVFHTALQRQKRSSPKMQFNKTKRLTLAHGISAHLEGLMATYNCCPTSGAATFAFPEFEAPAMRHFAAKSKPIARQCDELVRIAAGNSAQTVARFAGKKVKFYLSHLEELDRINIACALSKREYYAECEYDYAAMEQQEPEEWCSSDCQIAVPPPASRPAKVLGMDEAEEEEKVEIGDELASSPGYHDLPPTLVAAIEDLVPSAQ